MSEERYGKEKCEGGKRKKKSRLFYGDSDTQI